MLLMDLYVSLKEQGTNVKTALRTLNNKYNYQA